MDCLTALCQMRPVLGDAEQNLAAHHQWLDQAIEKQAQLIIFPELSLHGYFLRDLTQDVALRLDHPQVQSLVERSKDCSIVFGLVEESADHCFYNSAVFAEDGKILHVHRKIHLPDYGIFEEGRYFTSGRNIETIQSKWGRFGLLICEDAWHLSTGWLHFLQGADAMILPSASPARGIDTEESEVSSQGAWNTLVEAHALFFQAWVLHCNRVGFEDGTLFWGGSRIHNPFGECLASADSTDEELLLQRIDSGPVRRARTMSPLRRDTQPDLIRMHLARLLDDPDALARSLGQASDPANSPSQPEGPPPTRS